MPICVNDGVLETHWRRFLGRALPAGGSVAVDEAGARRAVLEERGQQAASPRSRDDGRARRGREIVALIPVCLQTCGRRLRAILALVASVSIDVPTSRRSDPAGSGKVA